LGLPVTPSLTRNRPLTGSNGFTPVYWMSLVRDHRISEQTAQHLAGRFGTTAPMVLDIAEKDADLAKPIVEGLAPIRAELVLVALTKFAAAGLTGSSAMVSEAIHSLVDTGNEILLLYGLRRAARPPDELHPLGHGRELYFWSFIVTLLIFALGAGVSVYEGISHVIAPVPISNSIVNYVVLGLAFVFEGISCGVAIKEFRSAKGKRGHFEAVRQSKD